MLRFLSVALAAVLSLGTNLHRTRRTPAPEPAEAPPRPPEPPAPRFRVETTNGDIAAPPNLLRRPWPPARPIAPPAAYHSGAKRQGERVARQIARARRDPFEASEKCLERIRARLSTPTAKPAKGEGGP